MDKNTSISLHLAKVMGLTGVELLPFGESGSQVAYIDGSGIWFLPFTNRVQWADVVLWAAQEDHEVSIEREGAHCYFNDFHTLHEYDCPVNESTTRMAATLEAIALATGWAP